MEDVTLLLDKISSGEDAATDKLLPLVYKELRQLADSMMRKERSDHTLQGTALVNEAYLRLVREDRPAGWDGRGHFFSAAAEAMRRILVEHARRKLGKQRGGDRKRVDFGTMISEDFAATDENPELVLEIDEALEELAKQDSDSVQLIKLRFFCGLSMPEAAKVCGIPNSSAYAKWQYAKARLIQLLGNN